MLDPWIKNGKIDLNNNIKPLFCIFKTIKNKTMIGSKYNQVKMVSIGMENVRILIILLDINSNYSL